MTAIDVSNTDASILSAVAGALSSATIDGSPAFAAVSSAASGDAARETQLTASPVAVVRHVGTSESPLPEGCRGCAASIEILLAAQAEDEPARLAEALRLKNAAINAVGASPPAEASAWGDGRQYHRRLQWGRARIDTTERSPWVLCTLGLDVGFVLPAATAH